MPYIGKKPENIIATAIDSTTGTFSGAVSVGAFTSNGIDDNADATAMTISSSEQIGIGTTSPNFMLDIVGSSQNLLELTSGGSFGSAIVIDQNTNSDSISIDSSGTGSPIVSNSAGASNIIAKSTNGNGGYLNYTGLSSSGSTTFSVTHNGAVYAADGLFVGGTGSANQLDDYEEGTWSPTIRGESGTEPTQGTHTATYVKVGQLVHIEARMVISTDNGGSGLEVVGFPFVTANAVVFHLAETAVFGVVGGMFSNGSVAAGSGSVFFREGNGTGAWQSGTYVQRDNGQYTLVGTYRTTS